MKPLMAAAATEATDDQLVAAAREGSDEAFEALFRRYRDRDLGLRARHRLRPRARRGHRPGGLHVGAARACAPPTARSRSGPGSTRSPRTPASTTSAGRAAAPRSRSTRTTSARQDEGRISQSVVAAPTPRSRAARSSTSLQMAFSDLPESQHEVLVMRELEGLSYDRIASAHGPLALGGREHAVPRPAHAARTASTRSPPASAACACDVAMEATADGRRIGMRERRRLTTPPARLRRLPPRGGRDRPRRPRARGRPRPWQRSAPRRRPPAAARLPAPPAGRRRRGAGLDRARRREQGVSLAGKATAVVVAAALAAGGAGVGDEGVRRRAAAPGVARRRVRRAASGSGTATGQSAARASGGASASGRRRGGRRRGSSGRLAARHGRRRAAAEARPASRTHGPPGGAPVRRGTSGAARRRVGGAERHAGPLGGTVGSLVDVTGRDRGPHRRPGHGHGGQDRAGRHGRQGSGASRRRRSSFPARTGVAGTGGGSSGSTPARRRRSLGDVQPSLPVQTPGVTVPQTGVTVPGTAAAPALADAGLPGTDRSIGTLRFDGEAGARRVPRVPDGHEPVLDGCVLLGPAPRPGGRGDRAERLDRGPGHRRATRTRTTCPWRRASRR